MSDKIENQEENINYNSKDIRKKDLKFNVKEDDSAKFTKSLKQIKQKIADAPIFKGKNKFIAIGIAIFVVAAAITLPVILPRIFNSSSDTSGGSGQADEETARREKQKEDTTDMLNELDPDAPEETKDAVLSELDQKIVDSATPEEEQFYTSSKAFALGEYKNFTGAVSEVEKLIPQYREAKMFTDLARAYDWISYLYIDAGDIVRAIEYAKGALAVVDEAASDPERPTVIAGRKYYETHIEELERQQQ